MNNTIDTSSTSLFEYRDIMSKSAEQCRKDGLFLDAENYSQLSTLFETLATQKEAHEKASTSKMVERFRSFLRPVFVTSTGQTDFMITKECAIEVEKDIVDLIRDRDAWKKQVSMKIETIYDRQDKMEVAEERAERAEAQYQAAAGHAENWQKIANERSAEIVRLMGAIERAESDAAAMWKALTHARDALYNGFEPDNQSRVWHEVYDALCSAAGYDLLVRMEKMREKLEQYCIELIPQGHGTNKRCGICKEVNTHAASCVLYTNTSRAERGRGLVAA